MSQGGCGGKPTVSGDTIKKGHKGSQTKAFQQDRKNATKERSNLRPEVGRRTGARRATQVGKGSVGPELEQGPKEKAWAAPPV